MFSTADTIVAVATPPGRGGLGVVRLSGVDAVRVATDLTGQKTPFEPRRATFSRLITQGPKLGSAVGDDVVVTVFPAPASYTGEDVVEISAHGSPVVLAAILRSAVALGARLAEPGEFTLRAFLNGKRDLVQAEAVADLIDAVTPLQARAAFDQLQGTLTGAIGGIEAGLFDLVARLEARLARFSGRGYHFIKRRAGWRAGIGVIAEFHRLLADAGRGRLVREGAVVTIVGHLTSEVEPLQRAAQRKSRHCDGRPRHDARSVDRTRGYRGASLWPSWTRKGIRETEDEVEREGVQRAHGSLERLGPGYQ
jgi:tRNA modification GTPase